MTQEKPVPPEEEPLLSIYQVQQRINVSGPTIHKWVHSGKLRAYKIGRTLTRYKMSDVMALFEVKNERQRERNGD